MTSSPFQNSNATLRSATAAYRADMSGRTVPFSDQDSGWIVVATLVEQATLVDGVGRETFLRDAIDVAEEIMGDASIMRLARREWDNRDLSRSDPIIFLADAVHFGGALNLAAVMFDALLVADDAMADVTRGRVMAKRARVAHKLSHVDEAADRYKRVDLLGRRAGIVELRIRAALGFLTIAQLRGNYPQLARFARRARRWATTEGLLDLSRQAHYGIMLGAAKCGQFEEALHEGWAVYEMSAGEPLEQATALVNLGQLLLEAGDARTARAAFATIVSLPLPARLLLPGLGGLAVASAACGEEAAIEWAVQEVLAIRGSATARFLIAGTLLECATALAAVGRGEEAERHRRDALRISETHGFHEIVFRAESLETSRRASPLPAGAEIGARGQKVATSLRQIAPSELPAHVHVAVAAVSG